MALICKNTVIKKETITTEINSEILTKIKAYCAWAGVQDVACFIEEAACFVFSKDKEWKKHQKPTRRTYKRRAVKAD